jgi:hypothetical protein
VPIDDFKCEVELPAVVESGTTVLVMVACVLVVFSKAILAMVPILERTTCQRSVSASVANENLQMVLWSPSIGIVVSFGQPIIAESLSTICSKINNDKILVQFSSTYSAIHTRKLLSLVEAKDIQIRPSFNEGH